MYLNNIIYSFIKIELDPLEPFEYLMLKIMTFNWLLVPSAASHATV